MTLDVYRGRKTTIQQSSLVRLTFSFRHSIVLSLYSICAKQSVQFNRKPELIILRIFRCLSIVLYCRCTKQSLVALEGLCVCVCVCVCVYVCVYSNSRNDVPRVAQRYGTIAAHTRRRASVLVVFVVFCVHMHSFAGLIRQTPPPTFSDTAITDRHSDTTIFQLRAHWVRISWSIGSEKSFGGVEPSTSCVKGENPIH